MAPHGKKLNVDLQAPTITTTSISVKKRSSDIILNAFTYINILKLKLEALKTESCLSPVNNQNEVLNKQQQEVEVEKKTENGFHIRVNCQQKGRDLLVSILEVFEEMGLEVLQASVSCNQHYSFCMEAMVEAQADHHHQTTLDAQAVSRALELKLEKKNTISEVIRM